MPTVLTINGYRFFFYSNENNEPHHIHVKKGEGNGKVWLIPVQVEYLYGFKKKQHKEIIKIVEENQEFLINAWNEYFGD